MITSYMLDAAFPPSPSQWVKDLQSIGAKVGAIYVYGPYVNYTLEHVLRARMAGIYVLPIIVPGNAPPAPPLYAAAEPYGITSGPIVYDIETGSLPGPSWDNTAIIEANAAGWSAGTYCNSNMRSGYPFGWWWRTGTMGGGGGYAGVLPPPSISLSEYGSPSALQYDFDVIINGSQYDVSLIDLSVFGVFDQPTQFVTVRRDQLIISTPRPDGGTDRYALSPTLTPSGGNVVHYVVDANDVPYWIDYPYGIYTELTECGYSRDGTYTFIRGVGQNNHIWQNKFVLATDTQWESAVQLV